MCKIFSFSLTFFAYFSPIGASFSSSKLGQFAIYPSAHLMDSASAQIEHKFIVCHTLRARLYACWSPERGRTLGGKNGPIFPHFRPFSPRFCTHFSVDDIHIFTRFFPEACSDYLPTAMQHFHFRSFGWVELLFLYFMIPLNHALHAHSLQLLMRRNVEKNMPSGCVLECWYV